MLNVSFYYNIPYYFFPSKSKGFLSLTFDRKELYKYVT